MNTNVNVAVVGHVHCGKSTLLGRYAWNTGLIPQSTLEAVKRLIAESGIPESHLYAALVHRSPLESLKQHTELPAWIRTEVGDVGITLIDTPGHSDYHKNMIYGIYQADCAVLAVRALRGVEQQTKDVLELLRCFEIPVLAISVTRMDEARYDQDEFLTRQAEACDWLTRLGFDNRVSVFPSAALRDEGVTQYSAIHWAEGETLRTVLGRAAAPTPGARDLPLRFVSRRAEVVRRVGLRSGVIGVVETGRIELDQKLLVEPVSTIQGRELELRVRSIAFARPGLKATGGDLHDVSARSIVALGVEGSEVDLYSALEDAEVHGLVAGLPSTPPRVRSSCQAELLVVEHPTSIAEGYAPTLNANGDQVQCRFEKIAEKRSVGGEWSEINKGLLRPGDYGRVTLSFDRPIVMEDDDRFPRLSRFVVRDGHRVVALGKATASRSRSE